jgi:hypothetical protein
MRRDAPERSSKRSANKSYFLRIAKKKISMACVLLKIVA